MAVTTQTGVRSYPDRNSRVIRNVRRDIVLIDKDLTSAGFLTFLNRVATENTKTERFQWDVDTYVPRQVTVSGSHSSSVTSITLTDNSPSFPSQLYVNSRTKEVLYVTSKDSGNKITVIRQVTRLEGQTGTAAAAMNDGDILYALGTVVGEEHRRQVTQTTIPREEYNFAQEMRRDLSFSRRQIKREQESGGSEYARECDKFLQEFRRDLNRQLLYGERGEFSTPEGRATTTKGIMNVPTSNVLAVNGTLHEYTWDEWLTDEALRRGGDKWAICSTGFYLAISQMNKDRMQYHNLGVRDSRGVVQVGIEINAYKAPNGRRVFMIEDRNLTDDRNGDAVIVDQEMLKLRTFGNNGLSGDVEITSDTQEKDDMGKAKTITCDMGLEWGAEEHHALITGVVNGSKGRAAI